MKILTGEFRGQSIGLTPHQDMRPTSDLARQAIFNTLQGAPEGRRVLDVFGGTGALGFEAISSGAREAVWIEKNPVLARVIEKTAAELGVSDRSRVIVADALAALKDLGKRGDRFDLIFLDPPYHAGLGVPAVELVARLGVFAPGAIVVLETHKTEDPPPAIGSLRAVKTKRHGDTKITFYREA